MTELNGIVLSRLPVLPLRGLTAFPNMIVHFDVGRMMSIRALEAAMKERTDHLPDRAARTQNRYADAERPVPDRHDLPDSPDPASAGR